MNDLPKPDLTTWDFGWHRITKRQDQCTWDVWDVPMAHDGGPYITGSFETYEGAVLSLVKAGKLP
jgi:hypothetical protein